MDAAEEKAAIQAGRLAAWNAEGYTRTEGEGDEEHEVLDKPSLVQAGALYLHKNAVVKAKDQRDAVAVSRGGFVRALFSNATPPESDQFDNSDVIAIKVWAQLDRDAWNLTNPAPNGAIQRSLTNSLVLCRKKLPPNEVWGVYLTNDLPCILLDYEEPMKQRVGVYGQKYAEGTGMVAQRNPAYSKKLAEELEKAMKDATALTKSTLALLAPTAPNGDEA